MTRIALFGISLIILLSGCSSTNRMSKAISKNSFPDSEGWMYYRDFDQNLQMRYLGDYIFTGIRLQALNKKLKTLNINIDNKDKVIFFAKTTIPPLHQSCLVETESISNYIKDRTPRKLNVINDNFFYLDSQTINKKQYLCIIWGLYNIPAKNTDEYKSNESLFINEADTIVKSLSIANKSFLFDLQKLPNEVFTDPFSGNANYISPILTLNKYLTKNLNESEENFLFQLLGTYHSFIGNSDSAQYYAQKAFHKRYTPLSITGSNITCATKKVEILAENYPLLLFNEAHTDIRNRNFVRQILPMLYAKGFKILALESLFNTDTLINTRKYPTIESGFYIREPGFSMLIREAINMGFKVAGYDTKTDCFTCEGEDFNCCNNLRELTQAKNIKNIADQNPNDKVVVLGGHDHIYLKTPSEKYITMAMQLKKMGLNFATIDQVRGNFYYVNKLQTDYVSFKNNNQLPDDITKLSADAYIIAPYKKKPEILTDAPYLLSFPAFRVPLKLRVYIKIYNLKDDLILNPIPVLVSELKKNKKEIKLHLPAGDYKGIISSKNKKLFQTTFSIK
jgi:hypothetical protein